jgi:transposase-like protein
VFNAEIIELCVRWYITYRLSYRDLVAMMAERGVTVAHSTILRWVSRYVPEYEKRWNRFSRPVGTSSRADETYISIRGKWYYLYRAVDKQGKTVDFLLRCDRGIAAAQAFFRKALATNLNRWPRKVTLDGHVPSHRALRLLRREDPRWLHVKVRSCKYLDNIVSRTIARSNAAAPRWPVSSRSTMPPLPLPESSWRIVFTNGNSHLAPARPRRVRSLKTLWDRALA